MKMTYFCRWFSYGNNVYHFDLNKKRTQLSLKGPLEDKIADNLEELQKGHAIIGQGFGRFSGKGDVNFDLGFGGISDIKVGPDGYLYVISMGEGAIYRIVPATHQWWGG
jgi:hypothetical protein